MTPWVWVPVLVIVAALTPLAVKLLAYPAQHAATRPGRPRPVLQIRSPWAPSWPLPAEDGPAWLPATIPPPPFLAALTAPRISAGRVAAIASPPPLDVCQAHIRISEWRSRENSILAAWTAHNLRVLA